MAETLREYGTRLLAELSRCRPEVVVTLGNAALRVLAGLGEVVGNSAPRKLAVEGYGRRLRLRLLNGDVEWLPLAHPASPDVYQRAHEAWCTKLRR